MKATITTVELSLAIVNKDLATLILTVLFQAWFICHPLALLPL